MPSMKAEDIYDCRVEGKPILHDTVIQLFIERDLKVNGQGMSFFETVRTEEKSESIQVTLYHKYVTKLRIIYRSDRTYISSSL